MQMRLAFFGGSKRYASAVLVTGVLAFAVGCAKTQVAASTGPDQSAVPTVGITAVSVKPIGRQLTVSSELVPYEEIDVYAKESGYIKELNVDYGSRVKKGDVMAILEIPELRMQLQQDKAAIQTASDQVTHAEHEIGRLKAQHNVAHLQFSRLKGVAETKPGLVAQQEIDDAQGKDLAMEAQVEAGESALLTAQSQLDAAQAKQQHDQVLFDYAKITAPFNGVVTKRYANYGALMQAGTNSSTQAMPLVRLSESDKFRLVIPVPESYVKYIRVGDAVQVRIPSLGRTFPGKVTRFSVDVEENTRTMHTEVDVPNPTGAFMPGMYAEATLTLEHKANALVVPLQAVSRSGDEVTVFLVDMNNRLQQRKISLGLETANEAEVTSGLNEGDRVVVSDNSGLKSGAEVKPQTVELMQYQGDTKE